MKAFKFTHRAVEVTVSPTDYIGWESRSRIARYLVVFTHLGVEFKDYIYVPYRRNRAYLMDCASRLVDRAFEDGRFE